MGVLQKKPYESLTIETAIVYAKERGLFGEFADIKGEEIGDGNLNYVFRLIDTDGKSLILKQALPYAKVVGESWPLTLKRAVIEANALKKHGEFVPHLVPKVYLSDEDLALTVMEDLSHLTIARQGLVAGESYPLLSTHLGEYLAQTLFGTSDFGLHPFEKKHLQAAFSNPELCKITEDLIFTDPYYDTDTNDFEEGLREAVEEIWGNTRLKIEVAKIKHAFLTEGEALVHGDLHTGSVFASATETKIIDPEFAFYGPIGFDIGQVIANFLFQAITRSDEGKAIINKHVHTVWDVFVREFTTLWQTKNIESHAKIDGFLEEILKKIFEDTLAYAGTELIRRTIGLAHVKDLDSITNDVQRIAYKKQALKAGEALILKRYTINSIEELLATVEVAK